MPFTKIPMEPGVYLDDTPTEAEGYWVAADKIRFVRGVPQTMAGWESYSSTLLNGVCRGLHTWADNSGIKWAMAGTHLQLYLLNDGLVYDCSPIISRSTQTSLTFTTDGSTAVVSLFWPNHGMVGGQRFSLLNPQYSSVGGTTVAGSYTVNANPGTSSLTYNAAQASTTVAANVAIYSDSQIFLAPGLKDGAAGLGFGTGYYSGSVGAGTTWSTPSAGANYLRTWDIDNFGQNAIAVPRGGGVYELSPSTSNPELTTNGNFAQSSLGWAAGSNWTFGAASVKAAGATSVLSQVLTITPAAYYEVEFTLSSVTSAGTLLAVLGPTSLTTVAAPIAQKYKVQAWGGRNAAASLTFTGASLTARLSSVTVTQILNAQIIPAAPTQNTCMVVTAERFVMVGGTIEIATGLFNPMHIRWSNINDEQIWVPNPLVPNLSSFYTLGNGSLIVGMKLCGSQVLIWTDTAFYVATYSTDSGIIYSIQQAGDECGLIGPHAAAVIGGMAYWLSPQGATFMYSGGVPQIVKSTMQQDMMNNIAFVQQDKIVAAVVGQFGDVMWIYPDERDATNENSRYALLCTAEWAIQPQLAQGVGIWAPGTFTRTAWVGPGVLQYDLAVDASGQIYYQEKGNSANGGPINWKLQTGDIQQGNGDTAWLIQSIIPDFAELTGGCTVSVETKLYPQSTPVVHGPFNVTSASTKVDFLTDAPVGRNASFIFEGMSAPAQMRVGHLAFIAQDTGMVY